MIHVLGFGAGVYILNHLLNPDQHRGEQGLLGHRGEQGIMGEKGERGLLGHRGVRGERGERGVRGERGERGVRGEKGEQGEFLECTSQNKMIDRVSDKLSRHIRNAPSVVMEVLMSKTTKGITTNKIGKDKDEENGVVSEELRKNKSQDIIERRKQQKLAYANFRKKLSDFGKKGSGIAMRSG